jgi:hypothetical protein
MDESKVVGVGRRRSRVEADRLALEYERSGMRRQDFCLERGISVHSLDSYRRRLHVQRLAVKPALLPVELIETSKARSSQGISSHSGQLRVELANGRRIVVDSGFSASLLKQVVSVLEA